jgi:hypothetical protein
MYSQPICRLCQISTPWRLVYAASIYLSGLLLKVSYNSPKLPTKPGGVCLLKRVRDRGDGQSTQHFSVWQPHIVGTFPLVIMRLAPHVAGG